MLFLILLFYASGALGNDNIINETISRLTSKLLSDPTNDHIYMELADTYDKQAMYNDANDMLKKALDLKPNDFNLAHRYACSCIGIGLIDQAIQTFQTILKRLPNSVSVLYNIGYTLKMCGKVDQAIDIYKKVLAADPSYDSASFALGHALLFKGDFVHGWKQHELHLKKTNKNAELLRQWLATNSIAGKKILLRYEGGMGDTLQFIRYAQLLKNKGATIFVSVQKPLVPLLSKCPYIDDVISPGQELPLCHEWSSLMSLPAIFNSNEQTIPRNIPYLYPEQSLIEKWQQDLPKNQQLKIGICWQADVFNDSSRQPVARRGIPLQQFYKLSYHKEVIFYSLQQKEGLEQLNNIPQSFNLHVFDDSFDQTQGAFMDTSAVMTCLDLIISVDTAVAHLAGALGRPVWLLLPYATDWRWIVNRTDSPWYPSMKIFKQPAPFDWDSVMKQVDQELTQLISDKKI